MLLVWFLYLIHSAEANESLISSADSDCIYDTITVCKQLWLKFSLFSVDKQAQWDVQTGDRNKTLGFIIQLQIMELHPEGPEVISCSPVGFWLLFSGLKISLKETALQSERTFLIVFSVKHVPALTSLHACQLLSHMTCFCFLWWHPSFLHDCSFHSPGSFVYLFVF